MQLKKRPNHFKQVQNALAFRHREHKEEQEAQTPEAIEVQSRGLDADVRFFVDHVISTAVGSIARQQSERVRLCINGEAGLALRLLISSQIDSDGIKFVAYSNDMCLFVGSAPSLFVTHANPRELEHAIYLYASEYLAGQTSVSAQIFRETASMFELPVLEGASVDGPKSLTSKAASIGV